MANTSEQTIRVRVGENLARHVREKPITQNELAEILRAKGFSKWDHSTVSRFIGGTRALTLEDAIILAAAVAKPLDHLIGDEGTLQLGDHIVPAVQIRNIIRTGHPIAELTAEPPPATSAVVSELPASQRIARDLDLTVEQLDDKAFERWDLTFDDELERRVAGSAKAWTGEDPRAVSPLDSMTPQLATRRVPVSQARHSGWVARHAKEMSNELL